MFGMAQRDGFAGELRHAALQQHSEARSLLTADGPVAQRLHDTGFRDLLPGARQSRVLAALFRERELERQKSCSTDPGRSAGTSEIRFLKAASATGALPSLVAFLMSDSSSAGFSQRSTNARIFLSLFFLSGTLPSALFLSGFFFLSVAMATLSPGPSRRPGCVVCEPK